MKKNIILIAASAVLLSMTSCEDNFDAQIYGQLSTTNFPASESDLEGLLMDCYIPFSVNWSYSFKGGSTQHNFYVPEGGIVRMLDASTDLCAPWTINSWGGPWLYMTQGQFDDMRLAGRASNGLPNHFEKIREITRFTEIINTIENADESVISATKKEQFLGEARLCRGLVMYYLMHFYGPVPVILDPALVGDNEAEAKLERPTLNEMTEYITADFEYAAAHAPETQAEKGRYTADYARFCLMRHYLNEGAHMSGYYQKAVDVFKQFKGKYSLFTNGANPYADQFKIANKFNSEVIMAVSCNSGADGSSAKGNFNAMSWYVLNWDVAAVGPFEKQGAGWGQCFNVDPQFYDTFEDGDLRKEPIVTSYQSMYFGLIDRSKIGDLWCGFIINKFPIETATSFQGTDIPLARWADALLLYAEALVRNSKNVSAEAVDAVNQVRHRAGLGDLSADKTASVDAFLDALIDERGHETYYEGNRKVDLIRFNKYYTKMSEFGRTPSSQYFPLPDYAIQQAEEAGYKLNQYFTRDDYEGPKR